MSAVASAAPSINPTEKALAPSAVTMNSGSTLWIISEEMSISMLTKPSTHTPDGICRKTVVESLRFVECILSGVSGRVGNRLN